MNLHSIRFSYVFVRFVFLRFCFSLTKYALFHPHFYVSISALTRQSHTGQKFSEKIFCKGVQLYFEISLFSFIHKIFEQNFYLYITVYLVRIWTYKKGDEKAHTLSRRSKNVKKRTKTYEKRILCKFTFTVFNSKTQDSRNQWLSCGACMKKAFFSFGIGTTC